MSTSLSKTNHDSNNIITKQGLLSLKVKFLAIYSVDILSEVISFVPITLYTFWNNKMSLKPFSYCNHVRSRKPLYTVNRGESIGITSKCVLIPGADLGILRRGGGVLGRNSSRGGGGGVRVQVRGIFIYMY